LQWESDHPLITDTGEACIGDSRDPSGRGAKSATIATRLAASQLTERETNPKERSKTAPKAQVKSGVSKKTKEEALAHQMELRKDVQRENRPSAEPIYLSGGHLTIAIGRAIEIFPASPSIMLVQCDPCRTSPGSTPCNSFGKIYAASNLLPSRVAHLLSSARKGHKITWIG